MVSVVLTRHECLDIRTALVSQSLSWSRKARDTSNPTMRAINQRLADSMISLADRVRVSCQ